LHAFPARGYEIPLLFRVLNPNKSLAKQVSLKLQMNVGAFALPGCSHVNECVKWPSCYSAAGLSGLSSRLCSSAHSSTVSFVSVSHDPFGTRRGGGPRRGHRRQKDEDCLIASDRAVLLNGDKQ